MFCLRTRSPKTAFELQGRTVDCGPGFVGKGALSREDLKSLESREILMGFGLLRLWFESLKTLGACDSCTRGLGSE